MIELIREQLWQWYVVEQKTSVEIAARVGLKANTIRARLLKAGIPVRPRGESQRLMHMRDVDTEELARRYQAGQSPQALADHFGTTRRCVISQLQHQGIYEAGRKYTGEHHWCTGTQQSEEHVQKRQSTKIQRGSRNGPVPVPLDERFWLYVQKTDRCWLWTGTNNGLGYGMIYDTRCGEKVLAHRVSWEIHHGTIPEGQNVLHRCDTPACVNPEHLFLGTHADNMADKTAKFRGRCAFKNEMDVWKILYLFRNGYSVRKLSEMFSVSVGTINNILSGRSYGHLVDIERFSIADRLFLRRSAKRESMAASRKVSEKNQVRRCAALRPNKRSLPTRRRGKLTVEEVRYIRQSRRADTHSVIELAQIFGVTPMTIYNVVRGRVYAHVADSPE